MLWVRGGFSSFLASLYVVSCRYKVPLSMFEFVFSLGCDTFFLSSYFIFWRKPFFVFVIASLYLLVETKGCFVEASDLIMPLMASNFSWRLLSYFLPLSCGLYCSVGTRSG